MFSLKSFARKQSPIIALGAAASLAVSATVVRAATLTFDPAFTPATPSGDALVVHNLNVATGSTLTMHNFTNGSYGSYGSIRMTGGGTVKMTGTFNNSWAFNQLFIDSGSLALQGTGNTFSGGITVASG